MQEMVGTYEDILFDLDQIKRLSQEEVSLPRELRERLERLPKKQRENRREEELKKQKEKKKEFLRIWTLEVEQKVQASDLPANIKGQILELTTYAKDRGMTFIYSIERKLETLKVQIQEAQEKKAREDAAFAKNASMEAMAVAAVVGGVALAPFVQVRFNPEDYAKKTESVAEKAVEELVQGAVKSVPPERTYPTKTGAKYARSHYELEAKHKAELMDALVRQVQEQQKAQGKPIQSAAEIIKGYQQMPGVKQRATQRSLLAQNPELQKQQAMEKAQAEAVAMVKSIERLRRKHAAKEAKLAKFAQRQKAQRKTIRMNMEKMSPIQQRLVRQIALERSPAMRKRQKAKQEKADAADLAKSAEQMKRKHAEKDKKRAGISGRLASRNREKAEQLLTKAVDSPEKALPKIVKKEPRAVQKTDGRISTSKQKVAQTAKGLSKQLENADNKRVEREQLQQRINKAVRQNPFIPPQVKYRERSA